MRLPRFPLVDWFAAAEGRFDLSLSHSDCEPLHVRDLLDENEFAKLARFRLGYGVFAGLQELREAVARQYATIGPDNVLIFGGASEAIYTFMRTMLNPNDEVVAPFPAFHTLHAIARSMDCRVAEWRPADELTCAFDVSALHDLCTARTRAIVLNFPHNPSGRMIAGDELNAIVETARKSNAFLFSDENFRLLEIGSTSTLPAACDLYEKAVSISSVSKTHGLGGLRIGWLATRCREIINAAKQYRFYTTESTNTPCQLLAGRALERGDEILARNRIRIAENLDRLHSFTQRHSDALVLHPPDAGTMALVEQKTPLVSTELCERLLDEERVFLVPGAALGMSDRLLRVGIGRDDVGEALNRFDSFLGRV